MSAARPDVVVVGGGPVGLAAAVEAASRGMAVQVVEPRGAPVDKACGEGLMPGAVEALDRLGVHPSGRRFDGIAYLAPDGHSGGRHAFSDGPGLGVRRTELHRALAERARQVGVRTVAARVEALAQDGDGVRLSLGGGQRVDAGWVLGCDGLLSTTRGLLGIAARSDGRRYGVRRHAAVAPWSRDVEVYWAPQGEAYVTPVAVDRVGVAVLTSAGVGFDGVLAALPALRDRLSGADWVDTARGAGPLLQKVERRTRGRVLLVGDAAGYVDALTGEGLRVGFAAALAAVEAVADRNPSAYERRWVEVTREYRRLTGALVTATRMPLARRLLPAAAGRLPAVFGRAVDALAG